jgi:hypothetical protein
MKLQNRVITPKNAYSCVVVDVDGTVAEMGDRSPYDWEKVGSDKPKRNVINMVRALYFSGKEIVFLTGRDGCCYDITKKWLEENVMYKGKEGMTPIFKLFSRTADDNRPDCDIKEELLIKHILPTHDVDFCIDDRKQMVDHYRALGLECWQVDAGRF